MREIVAAQLRRRAGRALALLAGILIATAGLTVMTASAQTVQLREIGGINANSRASYDILVRPRGVQTGLEKSQGLVRGDFLSGIYGGITLRQWHEILAMPGVQVAAPVEILGYALPTIRVPIYLTQHVPPTGQALFRLQSTWVTDDGLTKMSDQPDFVDVMPYRLSFSGNSNAAVVHLPGGRTASVCPQQGPRLRFDGYVDISCVTRGGHGTEYGWPELWAFPFLIAAIDPTQEAKLDHLDKAVVSGRYLRGSDSATSGSMPVLVSDTPEFQLNEHVSIERLGSPAVRALMSGAGPDRLSTFRGTTVATESISAADAYRYLLQQLLHPAAGLDNGLGAYWTGSAVRFRETGTGSLTPLAVHNPLSTWSSNFYVPGGYSVLPIDGLDTAFEHLSEHVAAPTAGNQNGDLPVRAEGTFDAGRSRRPQTLRGFPSGSSRIQPSQAATALRADCLAAALSFPTATSPATSSRPPSC